MPSGCTKCPGCGQETLQPYPARKRAYCLDAAGCGYSEDLEPDLHSQVAALVGVLEQVDAWLDPKISRDAYKQRYRGRPFITERVCDALANLPAEALEIARKAQQAGKTLR